ncbi:transmembrane protein [Rhynchospora pubera]|uniref:Transmembrane protein n=1 Tax=Rhynchospora pubera TaxID=906938 RepID=A0AAV8EX96_9POAL|nr:transmembrane protein [Rhynchospora pubera]
MATGGASLSSDYSWLPLRWQTAVCFVITVTPAIAAILLLCRQWSSQFHQRPLPLPLWAPCFRGVPHVVLPVYRGLVAVLMSCVLYGMLVHRGLLEFYFYTQWTFLLVILYFLIGAIISAHGCWVYSRQTTNQDVEQGNGFLTIYTDDNLDNQTPLLTLATNSGGKLEDQTAGTWGYCMQIIYQTCGGAVMLTDVTFWCLLVPFMSSAHFSVNLIMGCMHSLNLLFLLVDTFLNNMPFPWFGMTYFILWSCTYVIFQWILHACGFSWWPYPFLELATPWAPLWYFCMALVHVPCYGIYWLIVKAKKTYFPKLFPHSYVGMC